MAGVSRQSLAVPHFAKKILGEQYDEVQWWSTCNNCFRLVANQYQAGCTIYDERYKEILREYRKHGKQTQ